jgi:hypothetical protein
MIAGFSTFHIPVDFCHKVTLIIELQTQILTCFHAEKQGTYLAHVLKLVNPFCEYIGSQRETDQQVFEFPPASHLS